MTPVPGRVRSKRRSPAIALVLSAIWAGLGEAYLGRYRVALLLGLAGLAILAALASLLLEGPEILVGRVLDPGFALWVIVGLAAAALFRVAAVSHTAVLARRAVGWRPIHGVLAVALAGAIIAVHALPGYIVWSLGEAGSRVFAGPDREESRPVPTTAVAIDPAPSRGPTESGETEPTTAPAPAGQGRVSVLFIGVDSGPGRDHALSDTMVVATTDRESRKTTMVSFPRDIASFPLWDGRVYRGKLNSLMSYAQARPEAFPDGPAAALRTELAYLLGIPIDYHAAVNIEGFARLVGLVGGVDVVNPRPIDDPTYGPSGFHLPAGRVHLDSETVLPFVRSRKGAGDNDFTRAARQQAVLAALRAKVTDPSMLMRLPELVDAADELLDTNIPASQVADMLRLAAAVGDDDVETIVLGPPYASHPPMSQTGGIYELRLDIDRLARLSRERFGAASRYSGG